MAAWVATVLLLVRALQVMLECILVLKVYVQGWWVVCVTVSRLPVLRNNSLLLALPSQSCHHAVPFLICSLTELWSLLGAAAGVVVSVRDQNHYHSILADAGEKLVVVDYFTTWCGPCKRISPVVEELASLYNGKVVRCPLLFFFFFSFFRHCVPS